MRHHIVRVSIAALLVAMPAVAHATRPLCNLVPDPPNDAYLGYTEQSGQSVPELDIHSVDVATGKKTLVVALTLASTDFANQKLLTGGATWSVDLVVWGAALHFSRALKAGPGAPTYTDKVSVRRGGAAEVDVPGVQVTVVGSALRWTLPRTAIVPELTKKNGVYSQLFGNATTIAVGSDEAPDGGYASKVKYKDKTPSCLNPA